jgi:hypothetical protein
MSCFGFVIFEVNPATMDVCVTDLRLVTIEMIKVPGQSVQYRIRPIDMQSTDMQYHIAVMNEPDICTGLTTGLLSRLVMQHHTVAIMVRNAVVRDTGNSDATFLLETADPKTLTPYIDAVNESTAIFGGNGATIAGISRGGDTIHEAREEAIERTWLHDMRVIRNMAAAGTRRPMRNIYTRMEIEDVNPSSFGFIPVPAGKTARQRTYPPANRDFVQSIMHMERVIVNAFGVPYSIVEKHTGNHSNAVDLENELLQATCKRYYDPVQAVLETVSILLFDGLDSVDEILARMDEQSAVSVASMSKRDKQLRDELCAQAKALSEPPRLQVITTLAERNIELMYVNGVLTHDAYIDHMVIAHGCPREIFEKQDVRLIMREPETGAHGPGHHGESTLGKKPRSEQAQTRDPTSSSKRKRAPPT